MMPLLISPVPAPIQPDPGSKVLETHGFSESFFFFLRGLGVSGLLEEDRESQEPSTLSIG